MESNPCKPDCQKRSPTCHGECKEYQEWSRKRNEYLDEIQEKKRQKYIEEKWRNRKK